MQSYSPYPVLREKIEQEGLLVKSPLRYSFRCLIILGGIFLTLFAITQTQNIVIIGVDAVLLGLLFAQGTFIAHDIAHNQVFRSYRLKQIIGTLWFSVLFGASMRWWEKKHDLHHAHPNELGVDPDVQVPLAFSEEHFKHLGKLHAKISRHQRWLFFGILSFARTSLYFGTFADLFKRHDHIALTEAFLIVINLLLYFLFVFHFLSLATALFFLAIVFWSQSMNIGLAFAPNHKGMPLLPKGTKLDFMTRQIMTSRNINPGLCSDFFYGGLNYQIEHHLFPTLPRHNLRRASQITKEFCASQGIDYLEVSPIESIRQIYQGFFSS